MATIASLRVGLEADTNKFRGQMEKATAGVKRFAAAAGAVAVAGGALIKAGLDSADEIQKLALRTGVGVEALSALKHAAELSDVSLSQLERGFGQLNRSLGEAEQGTAAQADAFKALGIDIKTLKQLAPEQQFGLISDRLNALNDEAQAAAIGNDIFGGSYRKLLPLIKTGSTGMQEAADQAAKLGLVLSEDNVNAAAEANDALTTLSTTASALGRRFALELAPAISIALSGLTERLPGIIASIRAAFAGVGNAIGGVAAAAVQFASGDFSGALTTVQSIGDHASDAVQEELDKVTQNTGDQVRILTDINANLQRGVPAVAG